MSAKGVARRRPSTQVTEARAARLHRLVRTLCEGPRSRAEILERLGIGLRTFYRELELLRRCGLRVRLESRRYTMQTSREDAEGRLPFPDPRLSFAEVEELALGSGPAARRIAGLLQRVLEASNAVGSPTASRRRRSPKGGGAGG